MIPCSKQESSRINGEWRKSDGRPQPIYLFTRGEGVIPAEVYFPKKVEYQGIIYKSLHDGYDQQNVKDYLQLHTASLLIELAEYAHLFNPYQYGTEQRMETAESPLEQARKRIAMYKSPFRGWSMYEVDGMFFNGRGRIYEERTQVIRLMFRFGNSSFIRHARRANATDVLRSIILQAISIHGLLETEDTWDEQNTQRYLALHGPWQDEKRRRFAEKYYSSICREVGKWIGDCVLFIFGYLVREFSQRVLEADRIEEEIWVMSFFDMTLNVVRKSRQHMIIKRSPE